MAKARKAARPGATPLDEEALERLLGERKTIEQLDDLFRQMKRRLMEKVLDGELTHHLGYKAGDAKPEGQANHRNGSSPKTVLTEDGALSLAIPRDRAGTFEPLVIPKHARRLPRFDQNVISLYARGMTTREIQAHLEELYQVEVTPDVISTVTDAVLADVQAWQQRPLDACYPVVILDAMRVKIRDEGVVKNKAVYVALAVRATGAKEVLGLWIEQTEGAAFWHRVLTDLAARGVEDILIALIDGLSGFPEAIHAVFPQTQIHQCVVHLVRRSLAYVPYGDRKAIAHELKAIYRAPTLDAAEAALDAFAHGATAKQHPAIVGIWRRAWEHVTPVFHYPPSVRRLLSTTNAVESLHMQLRKIIKTRGHFPTDEAAKKLLYLALHNATKKWANSVRDWRPALPPSRVTLW